MVISCIDFSENYVFKTQNEVQDMHWYIMPITLLVHITYRVNVEYDVTNLQSFQVLKEVRYYINDDKTHDNIFVQQISTLHCIVMTFLVRECYGSPKKHENLLKFVKIRVKECFDKVLYHVNLRI
jgi:hypothetical protein